MKKTIMIAASTAFVLGAMSGVANAGAEKKCAACHNFTAANKVGPGLAGIVGRAAGKHEGFKYKASLAGADWKWDEAHLRAWMCNSKDAIKEFTGDSAAKTKMPPMNICDKAKQDEVIAFLKTI